MTKLLIVDDMAIFREPIAALLRQEGFDAVCAPDGRKALELIHSEQPDLVLLDVAMPKMDGLSCLRAIRTQFSLRDIPVVMLTALSDRETLSQAMRIGIQGYLLKSQFSLDDLLKRVQEVLGSQPSAATQPPSSTPSAATTVPSSPPPAPEAQLSPLSKDEVLEQIAKEAKLRAVPTVLHHVLTLTGNNRTSFEELGTAVRKDHALALKVMKVANSSFFGRGKAVQTLAEAAHRIGMNGVRNAIASILTIEHFSSVSTGGITPQRFWEHSLATASLADLIGQTMDLQEVEHLFLAGLLHDIGRLVLGTVFPQHYQRVMQLGRERNIDLIEVEREMFGLGHDEATGELLQLWNTPENMTEAAVAHELDVEHIQSAAALRDPQSALIVSLANRLAHAAVLGDSGNAMLLPFRKQAKALHLEAEAIHAVVGEATEKTQETEIFYASRTDQDFRIPLRRELGQHVEGRVEAKVFATGAPADPLSLFCGQLGWTASRRPSCAILSSSSDRGLVTRFNEMQKFEETIGTRLSVVVASPDGTTEALSGLLESRHWVSLRMPGRVDRLIDALTKLAQHASQPYASV